jgi:hypothetical protein
MESSRVNDLSRDINITNSFDNQQRANAAPGHSRQPDIRGWLADQWPKAAIACAFALTVAWSAFLVWSLINLF